MAARISLSDFQAELARKLAESTQRPMSAGWLGIAWQGVHALLPLSHAGEIFNPSALQRLPHTQSWVLGVTSLRGGLSVVVDWVRLLGLASQDTWHPAELETVYWVSLNPLLGVGAALCADHLLGLHGPADFHMDAQAPAHPAVRQLWRDGKGQTWHELDLVVMAQSPEFLDPRLPAFATPAHA